MSVDVKLEDAVPDVHLLSGSFARHIPYAPPGTDEQIDGLVGSSPCMRVVFDRLRRVARTETTVLITGGFGPQPNPGFIEIFCESAVHYRDGTMEGAGKDATTLSPFLGHLDAHFDRENRPLCSAALTLRLL